MSFRERFVRWLFRLGRDEKLPVVLTQRRIFILPTGAGVLYATVLVVMLIGAINYNLSLGHALVFLLAGIGLIGMLHAFRNLLGIKLHPGRAEPVFSGETAHFPLQIENTRPQPRGALEFSFGHNDRVLCDVPPEERAVVAIPFATTRRGRIEPGRITLASRYPLGLFRVWSYPHPPLSCLVYPKPIETPLPSAMPASQSGGMAGIAGQEDFSGLRQHQPNDSPRHIAWKAVARDFEHRPLLVKQFDGGAIEELWLDWSLTPASTDVETRLSLLAGWTVRAEREHRRYGMRLPGCRIAPDSGATHRNLCLEALALYGD